MFKNVFKAGLALLALAFSAQVLADTGFKVPVHYNVELVDGVTSPDNYSRFSRTISLTPGRHQVVVSFKDTFGGASDGELVSASNPIVVEIMNLKENQVLSFEYNIPTNLDQARRFARQQKVNLIDYKTEKPVNKEDAYYFILASETGFTMMRDYRTELLTLNRLYAPTYVAGSKRNIGMTDYGSPIIEATAASDLISGNYTQNQVMDAPALSASQNSSMSTSSKSGKKAVRGSVSFNKLVEMYNKADDATKLKFVKYVMSH